MNIWYNFVKFYIRIGLFFTLKNIKVHGKQNIPKKGAIIFIANHQNALIDALLIPTSNGRLTHSLARASAFKKKLICAFLNSVNMLPIYRIRDGISTIENNYKIFEKCVEILKNEGAIQIFAEGEHHQYRRIIPLKKGFARIILTTLQKYPDLNIKIVPVGLNYDYHLDFPSKATVYYGEPIEANNYFNVENPDLTYSKIIKDVSSALKRLTLHINDIENYDKIKMKLEAAGVNYLNPVEAYKLLEKLDSVSPTSKKSAINWFKPFHILTKINSVFPLLIWRYFKKTIQDIIFTNTFRFALILTIFPFFYLVQAGILCFIFNTKIAIIYIGITILLGIITTKTMQISQ